MELNELTKEIEVCAYCPLMCKNMCCFHSAAKNESSAPTMKNLLLDWSQKDRIELKEISGVMYQCTLCGQCTQWCEEKRDIPNNMIAARAEIVNRNMAPTEVKEVEQSTIQHHNPFGKEQGERNEGVSLSTNQEASDNIFLFVGCTTAYYQENILDAFGKITAAAGVKVQTLQQDEWCCGLPQYKLGLKKNAVELAQHNVQALSEQDCQTLLFICPTCYSAFRDFYSEWGIEMKFEVKFISEYILDLIDKSRIVLNKDITGTLTYHDPCALARPLKAKKNSDVCNESVVEEPRDILKKIPGVDFVEMRWNREKSFCCGGDVATRLTYPQVSAEIGKKAIDEAVKVEADYLVTSCPACNRQFIDVLDSSEDKQKIEVLSLCEIVANSIE